MVHCTYISLCTLSVSVMQVCNLLYLCIYIIYIDIYIYIYKLCSLYVIHSKISNSIIGRLKILPGCESMQEYNEQWTFSTALIHSFVCVHECIMCVFRMTIHCPYIKGT